MPAYNNYFPVGYQPYQQSYYQPQYVPPQPQQTAQPAPQSIIWVSGEQEAQMYPIAPNNAVTLWDRNGKAVYVKSADATGKPTMRVYDLVERAETPPRDAAGAEYVTKNELAAFGSVIENIRGEIETMRGDLYGIAGKKKAPARKTEEPDDE